MGLEIFVKLLIGFAIFFASVIFNVKIMSGKNPSPFMAKLSLVAISAGLIILVIMANNIDLGKLVARRAPDETTEAQQWF